MAIRVIPTVTDLCLCAVCMTFARRWEILHPVGDVQEKNSPWHDQGVRGGAHQTLLRRARCDATTKWALRATWPTRSM